MLALPMLGSCAGVKTVQVQDKDHQLRGFRYYAPAWYILAYVNGDGTVVTKHLILPDSRKKMSAYPYAFLATNTVDMQFENGMLTSQKVTADADDVSVAIVKVAEAAVKAYLAPSSFADAPTVTRVEAKTVPGPYLFKLVADGDGNKVMLVGGNTDEIVIDARSFETHRIGSKKKEGDS